MDGGVLGRAAEIKVIGRGGTLRRLSIRRVIHSFRVEQSAAPGKAVCEMTKLATGVDEAK